MEIEEQLQNEPHNVILQEGHITTDSTDSVTTSDGIPIDKSLFEFDVTIVGKNGQVQLIRKDDNKNRVFKARLTFHNLKFSFSDWNVLPAKLEEEHATKKRKHDSSLNPNHNTSNTLLLETKYIVKGKRDDEFYNTNLDPPSFEEGRIVDFELLPPDQRNVIDFRLSKFLTTKEVRSSLKDSFKEIGRDQISLRFSLTHAESRKEVASFNFPWQNPPKKLLSSSMKSDISSPIVEKSLHNSSLDHSTIKIKSETIEVMDLSQSITLGDSLPENWRLVDQEQTEFGLQISETKRFNLLLKGKSVLLKVFVSGENLMENQEHKNLFLAGVCYKLEGKWLFKSGTGFILESARQVDNGIEVSVRTTQTTFTPCHILFTPTVESINFEDLTSVPFLYSSATSVILNNSQKISREIDLIMYLHEDKLTLDDLVRIVRSHLDKRMGSKFGAPKVHESQVQRLAKQAFTFDAHAHALAFITREAFEPFWEWLIEIEDIIEKVAVIWNVNGVHIMDATEAQNILEGQEEGTFLLRITPPPLVGIVISLVNSRKQIVHYITRKEELSGDRLLQAIKIFSILKRYVVSPHRGSRPLDVLDKPTFTNLNQILESYRIDNFMTLFIKECILNMPSIAQELSEMGFGKTVNIAFMGKTKQFIVPPSFTFDQLLKLCPVKDSHLFEFRIEGKTIPGAALVGDLLGNLKEPTLLLHKLEMWE